MTSSDRTAGVAVRAGDGPARLAGGPARANGRPAWAVGGRAWAVGGPAERGDGRAVRVGIQSADRLRRETLAACLDDLPSVTVVSRVANPADVLSMHAVQRPAIVVLDACGDVVDALAVARAIRERGPEVCLVLMYGKLPPSGVRAAREVMDALVPRVHGFDGVVAVLERLSRGLPRAPSTGSGLSPRQRDILLLLASGDSTGEIAGRLGISPGTVENHKRRVYAKLNATSAVQAVAQAVVLGIIDGQPGGLPPGAAVRTLPAPPVQRPRVEPSKPVLALVVGEGREGIDRVAATLIGQGYPVLDDRAPSGMEPVDGLRWHRGPVVRVLVDPNPDHWRVGAVAGRRVLVVHSGPTDDGVTMAAVADGAAAVLSAEHIEERLVPMLVLVARGYRVVRDDVAQPLARFGGATPARPPLTAREYDILRSIGRSHTLRQTARSLGIAVKTVENTQSHLFRKLGVRNRAEALAAAYSLGLLRPT